MNTVHNHRKAAFLFYLSIVMGIIRLLVMFIQEWVHYSAQLITLIGLLIAGWIYLIHIMSGGVTWARRLVLIMYALSLFTIPAALASQFHFALLLGINYLIGLMIEAYAMRNTMSLLLCFMLIVILHSCNFKEIKGMFDNAGKITSVMENNCECEKISMVQFKI